MSLSWIKLHANLPEHPKSDLLEAELLAPRAWTYVVQLWLWASKVRPNGDLSGLPPAIVARRSGWEGDAVAFIDALRKVGFLDGDVLHGWEDEQGAHLRKAERDRDRAKTARAAKRTARNGAPEAESRDGRATVAEPTRDGRGDVAARVAGERRGEESRGERESSASRDALTSSPAATGGKAPSGGSSTSTSGARRRYATRLPHEMDQWQETPEALLAAPDPANPALTLGASLAARYPALDGQRGRPQLVDVVRAKFPSFEAKFFAHGPASAFPALITWVGEGYRQHLFSFEKDGNLDPGLFRLTAPAQAPASGPRSRPVPDDLDEADA